MAIKTQNLLSKFFYNSFDENKTSKTTNRLVNQHKPPERKYADDGMKEQTNFVY